MAEADYDPFKFTKYPAISRENSIPLRNATAMVYATDDLTYLNPLPITDWQGVQLAALVSDPQGVFPAFRCEGHPSVIAKSGPYTTEINSEYGLMLKLGMTPQKIAEAIASGEVATAAAQRAEEAVANIPIGGSGREVRLRKTTTQVQWQYVGDDAWTNLIPLTELQGAPGASVKGDAGQSPQLRTSGGYVQWKLPNDTNWINLVATSELGGGVGAGNGGIYRVLWNGGWVNPTPPAGFQGLRIFDAQGQAGVTAYDGVTIAGVSDEYRVPKSAVSV